MPSPQSQFCLPRRRRRAAASTLVLLAVATLSACGWGETAKPAPSPVPSVGSAAGRFVGSEACGSCHASEFEAWGKSSHRATLRPWSASEPLRAAGSHGPFHLGADGQATGPGTDGSPLTGRVEFLLGGRDREDVLVRLPDGRLQVFPLSYDVGKGVTFAPLTALAGGNAPPADTVEYWTRAGRNADLACYGCHATGQILTVAGRSPSGLALPASQLVETGVGCEACHGPGGPHIDAATKRQPSRSLVRLAKGTGAATSIATCASCHALREVLASPFSSAPAHRYGEPLTVASDPLLSVPSNFEFRDPLFPDFRPATFQQEAVAFGQNGCATKGGMVCASCHDPHAGGTVPALAAADGGDSICAPCHAPVVKAGREHAGRDPAAPGGRCLDCHMPATLRGPASSPSRDHLFAVATSEGRRRIARAVASARERGREGVTELGRQARDAGAPWFVRWASLQHLVAPMPGPVPLEAREAAKSALSDPDPALRRAAARALARIGDARDAEAIQRASSDEDPWVALDAARALGALGLPTAGGRLLQLLQRPDLAADARAQFAYGHACVVGQDHARGEKALRRALELNPYLLPAMNDLGLALVGQGRRDEARAVWRTALDVNPRLATARDNLAQLDQSRENQRENTDR
jgi:predicted CXXCH cytochrome family protein